MHLTTAHVRALDLNALVWAFSFASHFDLLHRAGILEALVAIGREVDDRLASVAPDQRINFAGYAPVLTGQYDGYSAGHAAALSTAPSFT